MQPPPSLPLQRADASGDVVQGMSAQGSHDVDLMLPVTDISPQRDLSSVGAVVE